MFDLPEQANGMRPLEELTEDELRQECQGWRRLWTWIPEDCRYYLLRIGNPARIVTRQYRGYLGTLGQPHFQVTELEVNVVSKEYNPEDGHYYWETKTLRLPVGAIAHIEFLSNREEAEEVGGIGSMPDVPKIIIPDLEDEKEGSQDA